MKITFIGAGYVGLVTGLMLSYLGHDVTCIDNDSTKIAGLKLGKLPIYEPGLQKYLALVMADKKIIFTDKYDESLKNAEIIFIAVGTPSLEDGSVNLEYVKNAINRAAKFAKEQCLFVIKSTVPPGTCNNLKQYLLKSGYNFSIASNPEFLREGVAVDDFLNPHRIVIGIEDIKSEDLLKQVYAPLLINNTPIVITDLNTSELIKYSSNSFLAIKVAFINEMANLCEVVGADIESLSFGIGLDSRIGEKFLKAGPGFGGSCFPKDTLGLSKIAQQNNIDTKILNAAISANKSRAYEMVEKIKKIFNNNLQDMKLAVLGLTFKAGTDDIRESPAINIIKLLQNQGANIIAYDPQGMGNVRKLYPKTKLASSINETVKQADALIILTEWEEFKNLDWDYIYSDMTNPIIIDLRNMLDAKTIKDKGFKYYMVGRKSHPEFIL